MQIRFRTSPTITPEMTLWLGGLIGSARPIHPSAIAITTNAGHIQAPRQRQRVRAIQAASMIEGYGPAIRLNAHNERPTEDDRAANQYQAQRVAVPQTDGAARFTRRHSAGRDRRARALRPAVRDPQHPQREHQLRLLRRPRAGACRTLARRRDRHRRRLAAVQPAGRTPEPVQALTTPRARAASHAQGRRGTVTSKTPRTTPGDPRSAFETGSFERRSRRGRSSTGRQLKRWRPR